MVALAASPIIPTGFAKSEATFKLTEEQQQELATLHKDILAKKKELVSRYVEYGVISEERGQKIISRLEKRYEMLQQDGFIHEKWIEGKMKGS